MGTYALVVRENSRAAVLSWIAIPTSLKTWLGYSCACVDLLWPPPRCRSVSAASSPSFLHIYKHSLAPRVRDLQAVSVGCQGRLQHVVIVSPIPFRLISEVGCRPSVPDNDECGH